MRHGKALRKLGRTTAHRMSLLRNLSTSFFDKERISTTLPKAKELRPFAEKLITLARRDNLHSRRHGRPIHPEQGGGEEAVRHPGTPLRPAPGGLQPDPEAGLAQRGRRRDGDPGAAGIRACLRQGRQEGKEGEEAEEGRPAAEAAAGEAAGHDHEHPEEHSHEKGEETGKARAGKKTAAGTKKSQEAGEERAGEEEARRMNRDPARTPEKTGGSRGSPFFAPGHRVPPRPPVDRPSGLFGS